MGSGFVFPSEPETARQTRPKPQPPSVMVRESTAERVVLVFNAEGQAQPDHDTTMRAEASGNVVDLFARKGERVAGGTVIARLSSARAREALARATRDFANAQALLDRVAGTADRVADTRAALAAAEAQVAGARQELENLDIVAPFSGRIETLTLDRGEFVAAGEDVGRIVDERP